MTDKLSVADVLDRAADLVTPPGAWTQGTLFRDSQGREAAVFSEYKSCYCMAGALVATGGPWSAAWSFLDEALPKPKAGNPAAIFNDAPERTQTEVVSKLREAANLARERGL